MAERRVASWRQGGCFVAAPVASLLILASWGCRWSDRTAARPELDSGPQVTAPPDALIENTDASDQMPADARMRCIHQRRIDLGAPVHRARGGRGGLIRLSECTRVALIEGDERWSRIAFPLTDDRTEGWITRRYLVDCGACAVESADGGTAASDGGNWPPQPVGQCLEQGATGRERLVAGEDGEHVDRVKGAGGAKGVPGTRVVVASFNVWELYDGQGDDRYLSRLHDGTPEGQYRSRIVRLAEQLRRLEVDLLLLQEVENAAVACALAEEAWPRSGWSCAATRRGGSSPMNLAIASRLKGTVRHLRPADARSTGPRGALEISLEGAGGLTVTTVHLKSSRGQVVPEDCHNARRRMGSAVALAARYQGWASVLIAGDFNVDPLDMGRSLYDRTDDVLVARGFERLCPVAGCSSPTYVGPTQSSSSLTGAIDLAFFHGGGRWRAVRMEVIGEANRRNEATRVSDHRPIIIELRR